MKKFILWIALFLGVFFSPLNAAEYNISQLPEAVTIADADYLLMWATGTSTTQKLPISLLWADLPFGTGLGTVCQGNDSRLSDARTPTIHSGAYHSTDYLAATHTSTYNHANYDTAYSDRLKWDGGDTGLTPATGRTSLGLGALAVLATVGPTQIDSTAVTPGSYTNTDITVDADGRITAASNGSGGVGYTDLTEFLTQTEWRLFYSNGSGNVVELALGSAGEVLASAGASAAPTWVAHTSVDWTADQGATNIHLGNIPNLTGAIITFGDDATATEGRAGWDATLDQFEIGDGAGIKVFQPEGEDTNYEPAKGADDNYVTDAEKAVIGNTTNTNSGNDAVNTTYDADGDGSFADEAWFPASGGMTWEVKEASFTAVADHGYLVKTVADTTITMPAATAGDIVGLDFPYDYGAFTVTVDFDGAAFQFGTANMTIDNVGAYLKLVYVDATCGWRAIDVGYNSYNIAAATDTTPPTLSTASIGIDGLAWTFVFDEPVSVGAGGSAGWAVTTSTTGAIVLTYTSGSGTSSLVYTGDETVLSGETITAGLDYTQPGNGIEDDAGNDLASINDKAVTNNSEESGTPECGVAKIAGYDSNLSSSSDVGSTTRWKAHKILAADVDVGTAGCIKVYCSAIGAATTVDTGFAIYSHDAGNDRPDTLLGYSYNNDYDWSALGAGVLHSFILNDGVEISDATDYWIGSFCDSADVEKETTTVDATDHEVRTTATGQSYNSAPAGSAYTTSNSDAIVGLSIW